MFILENSFAKFIIGLYKVYKVPQHWFVYEIGRKRKRKRKKREREQEKEREREREREKQRKRKKETEIERERKRKKRKNVWCVTSTQCLHNTCVTSAQ
jgi:hypothetical protein